MPRLPRQKVLPPEPGFFWAVDIATRRLAIQVNVHGKLIYASSRLKFFLGLDFDQFRAICRRNNWSIYPMQLTYAKSSEP